MLGELVASKDDRKVINQDQTPLYQALVDYANQQVTAFDVPGHKRGINHHPLNATFGEMTLKMDANSMVELDLLSHPESVIKEAQQLAASAFGAEHAYFLVNGTTVGILAMILAACQPGDTLIVPRNCHKSVMNGIMLSGANPAFIQPEIDAHFGIAHGVSLESVQKAITRHPQAKAVLITYPTYFGSMSDLQAICQLAHQHQMMVLVDSAHGAHLTFYSDAMDAIEAGADAITLSMHKTGGSLTQSSLLISQGERLSAERLQKNLNMLQTTSASYLLMSSIDVARRELVLYGEQRLKLLKPIVMDAIEQIEAHSNFHVLTEQYVFGKFKQQFDWTKLVIRVNDLGLTGFEVYTLLKQRYGIQAELAEGYVVMCVISYMDTAETIQKLVEALQDIQKNYSKNKALRVENVVTTDINTLAMTPQQANHADGEIIALDQAIGRISKDSLMIYPPGIPLIIPGEVISQQVLQQYNFYCHNFGNVLNETVEKNTITVVKGDR